MLRSIRPFGDRVGRRPVRSRFAPFSATLAALALGGIAVGITACGTREDDGLGVGILASYDSTKAVQSVDVPAPDASADFQLGTRAAGAATSTVLTLGARSG